MINRLIFIDTETTGVNENLDEVIQFSAIISDLDFSPDSMEVINEYCLSLKPISPEAMNIHHITMRELEKLSNGKFFEDVVRKYQLYEMRDCAWIAYKISFDIKLCNNTLVTNGYPKMNFGPEVNKINQSINGPVHFDSMKYLNTLHGYKSAKMTEYIYKCLGMATFRSMSANFNKMYGNTNTNSGFHNSLIDTYALYLIMKKYHSDFIVK